MSYDSLLINTCTIQRKEQVSVVIGTDGNDYYCKAAHVAAAADKPITGVDYADYWYPTGGVGVGAVWVLGTAYAASIDAYGTPVVDWNNHLPGELCRWSTPINREVKVGAEVVIADLQLFLRADTDITERDRVFMNSVTYEVLSASDRQNGSMNHHVECLLRTVR